MQFHLSAMHVKRRRMYRNGDSGLVCERVCCADKQCELDLYCLQCERELKTVKGE